MSRRPPSSTRIDPLLPYTARFRSTWAGTGFPIRSRRWVRRLSMAPRRLPPPQKEPRREPEKSEAQRARHQQPRRLAEAVQDRFLRAARRADLRPAVLGGHPRHGLPARTAEQARGRTAPRLRRKARPRLQPGAAQAAARADGAAAAADAAPAAEQD